MKVVVVNNTSIRLGDPLLIPSYIYTIYIDLGVVYNLTKEFHTHQFFGHLLIPVVLLFLTVYHVSSVLKYTLATVKHYNISQYLLFFSGSPGK